MGQILRPESIGTITKVSNTSLTISPSFVNLGGRQYSTSTLGISTSVSGAGGLDTGAIVANQFYYVYFIKNISGVFGVLSLSGSAPTGFTNYKLVGQCTTDGSSNLVAADKTKTDDSPIGHIISAMLTESQFRAIHGAGWILADGRSVVGSKYNTITTSTTVPDLRGMVLRGKNNGRSDGNQDPGGERLIGNFQNQATAKNGLTATASSSSVSGTVGGSDGGHTHEIRHSPGGEGLFRGAYDLQASFSGSSNNAVVRINNGGFGEYLINTSGSGHSHGHSLTAAAQAIAVGAGDAETRMRNIAVNHFIKIN